MMFRAAPSFFSAAATSGTAVTMRMIRKTRSSTTMYSRTFFRTVRRAIGLTMIASFGAAWYYRPLADDSTDGTGPNPSSQCFCSSENLFAKDKKGGRSFVDLTIQFLLSSARAISLGVTTVAIRLFMNTYGRYHLVEDEHYHHFLHQVIAEKDQRRSSRKGLLTVSNHRSLFDDPGVVSCLVPLHVILLNPSMNRWGICSQEYCFHNALPGLIKGYIGAGQVLPIRRGVGIDQRLFYDFAVRHLANGDWCHIFPEGGVWQLNELGGRRYYSSPFSARQDQQINSIPSEGKLKWGVGKLIAHAPVRPCVIPFAHCGMENLLPQDPRSRKTHLKKQLLFGDPLRVRIQFGPEIQFDDLIEEHERIHGKLWTYGIAPISTADISVNVDNDPGVRTKKKNSLDLDDFFRRGGWRSSPAEKELYHKITLRIERHLEIITREVVVGPSYDPNRQDGDRE